MGSFGGRGGEFGGVEDVHGWVISVCVHPLAIYESRVSGVGATMSSCFVVNTRRDTPKIYLLFNKIF